MKQVSKLLQLFTGRMRLSNFIILILASISFMVYSGCNNREKSNSYNSSDTTNPQTIDTLKKVNDSPSIPTPGSITVYSYKVEKTVVTKWLSKHGENSKVSIVPYFNDGSMQLNSNSFLYSYILEKDKDSESDKKYDLHGDTIKPYKPQPVSSFPSTFSLSNFDLKIKDLNKWLNGTPQELILTPELYFDTIDNKQYYHLKLIIATENINNQFTIIGSANPSPPNQPADYKKPN